MSLIKKRIYFYDLFKSGSNIPSFYDSIINRTTRSVLSYSLYNKSKESHKICKVNHLPEYLKIEYKDHYKLGVKSINRDVGYAIDLSQFSTIDTYVNHHFKNGRKIRKYVRRLETSFNITYKRYYGDISRDVYDDLLNRLHNMVQKRFMQLNDINQQINDTARWQLTLDETFSLIKKKRASLFVIYEDDKPILINIAHHWENLFYDFMVSFDIDYSKFSLGHISLYKQLEWCFNNSYEIFDLGPGEYHYKKRWSNRAYNLSQQVVYEKHNFLSELTANAEIVLTLIKKHLVSKKAKNYLKSIKKAIRKNNFKVFEFSTSDITKQDFDLQNYTKINYKNEDYAFLRKILFDFLYSKTEHKDDVLVFKNITESNRYIFKGKKNNMLCDIL